MNTLERDYEQDFHHWIHQHIDLLKAGRVNELDINHLIEELESMANRDRHELISHLVILIAHLLKWPFQLKQLDERWGEFKGSSWRASILEQRYRIKAQLENSPSLKRYLNEFIVKAYPKAVSLAAKETGFAVNHFPKEFPYLREQLLDDDFYPLSE